MVPVKDILKMAKNRAVCQSSAGADFLGEDVVDGEVVADAEEVAELDVLLPEQALPPSDLPHLGQDLKQAKNNCDGDYSGLCGVHLLKDGVLGLLSEVVLVGDVHDRLQGRPADERLPGLLEHPEASGFKKRWLKRDTW